MFFPPAARRIVVLVMAIVLGLVGAFACRQGMPVIDTTPGPAQADGTISGIVSGPEGTSPVVGRMVEVVNVATGERQRTATSNTGGFTFKVAPGRYRVELAVLPGEAILKHPGVMHVNRSDVDAHADFVVGSKRVSSPRTRPSYLRADDGLGAPRA